VPIPGLKENHVKSILTVALAATLAAQGASLAAQTPKPLPSPEEVDAAVRYALPHLLRGYLIGCESHLAEDGFMMTNAARLDAKFSEGAAAYWPKAKNALASFASEEGDDVEWSASLAELPDELVQPIMNGLISAFVASDIDAETCVDVERFANLMDPLPVDNIAGLVVLFVEIEEKDRIEASRSPHEN
jgi:hypothetical protein